MQVFVQDLSGGQPRAITPEGAGMEFAVAPDGRFVAAQDAHERLQLYPVEGGESRPLAGLEPGTAPVRFDRDGRILYVYRPTGLPGRIFAYDLATARSTPIREIELADPAGFVKFNGVFVSEDARAWACSYHQVLSELFTAEGLH